MNQKKAKILRKVAKELVSSTKELETHFYVEKNSDGKTVDSLTPMPIEWANGTYRAVYKSLK